MSVIGAVAREELLELRYNRGVLVSIAAFAIIYTILPSSTGSDLALVFLATLMGMYAAFGISGQAFNQEKQSGSLETTFCGPVELRELWFGKIAGTLIPAMAVAYAVTGLFLVLGAIRPAPVYVGLPAAIYLAVVLPALIAAFVGVMGFIQLNFNARQTRILSTAALVLIVSLLTASLSIPMEGSLISWQAVAVMGVAAALLLMLPALLVDRLSKERIVLTSEA